MPGDMSDQEMFDFTMGASSVVDDADTKKWLNYMTRFPESNAHLSELLGLCEHRG
jgi:predicted PolB exonuclease-like 3'-5' exonuclease